MEKRIFNRGYIFPLSSFNTKSLLFHSPFNHLTKDKKKKKIKNSILCYNIREKTIKYLKVVRWIYICHLYIYIYACVGSNSSPCFPFESTIVRKLNKRWHEGLVIEKYRRLDVSWKSATHVAYFFITRVFHLSTGLRLAWTKLRVRPGCSFSWDEKKKDRGYAGAEKR